MGWSNYSSHCAVVIDGFYYDYTFGGVREVGADFLTTVVWTVELECDALEKMLVLDRIHTLSHILKAGWWNWLWMGILWLFYRDQYTCTSFILSALGRVPLKGLTPDALYSII